MSDVGYGPQARLLGRSEQVAAIDRALTTAQAGSAEVLVLRGESGMGKTALLDYTADRAAGLGFRTWVIAGIESEMQLPFASLQQFCAPMLDRLGDIPGPQRDALSVAFGLKAGPSPNRFLVGMAVLGLLAGATENPDRPIACLVDDAQWLDDGSMQVLGFVARRLMAEPVALIFALRDFGDHRETTGLREVVVEGLPEHDARALLASAVPVPLDPLVRDRIIAEARGNPMALLNLPRTLAPHELAGGFWLPGNQKPASYIENTFHQRFLSLPEGSRRLLLTAAAEPTGDVALLWRAASLQDIPTEASAAAEGSGLVEFGTGVRFQHPLARSAIYRRTSAPDRRAAHRALAEATDPVLDPDRRAWHRAHAAGGPDESVAADLERSAQRARDRGGVAAAVAFLRRSAELTPDPTRRVTRALAAAQVGIDAGGADPVHHMLAVAEAGPLDALQRAWLERLRARLVFARARGSEAPGLLLEAARRLTPLDPDLARDTLLEAASAAIFAGRLSEGPMEHEVAEAARAVPTPTAPRMVDVLLEGIASLVLDGYAGGVPALRNALHAVRRGQRTGVQADGNGLRLAGAVTPEPLASELWDDEAWHDLAADDVRIAREEGALAALPLALNYQACFHVHAGEFTTAASLLDEAAALSVAVGSPPIRHTSLVLAAWRAQESEAMDLIRTSMEEAGTRGEGRALGLAEYATALLNNGLGRYDAAMAAATSACRYEDLGFFGWALIELIEAAARSGRTEAGEAALDRLVERTQASGTEWARGAESLSRALMSDGGTADALYQEARRHLEHCRISVHLARARLLHGEWLRRQARRQESRAELRSAYTTFSAMGAAGFAERARRELLATGETARRRTGGAGVELTSQEAQIARMAQSGYTNREIADHLFISPRTVEWHLGNLFAKLGVTSRRQLRSVLSPLQPGMAANQRRTG
ncbi:AAA family ATPase [Streptomyces sp. NPDC086077]|uniref:helix-turn-helix transcriptional regulator n=1 Tax=Streptomyces sp. NPDC086077 TaxID=3154862 RepID=UPI003413295C